MHWPVATFLEASLCPSGRWFRHATSGAQPAAEHFHHRQSIGRQSRPVPGQWEAELAEAEQWEVNERRLTIGSHAQPRIPPGLAKSYRRWNAMQKSKLLNNHEK